MYHCKLDRSNISTGLHIFLQKSSGALPLTFVISSVSTPIVVVIDWFTQLYLLPWSIPSPVRGQKGKVAAIR